MSTEILRIVDTLSREKSIEKEMVFADLEEAIASAVRKRYGHDAEVLVNIDRVTGGMSATHQGQPIDPKTLGRIAAQNAKQIISQRLREAERGSIFDEYSQRVGQIVTGTVSRVEGGAVIVNLGRAEGFLPRSEQIPGESYTQGQRIRGMILDVRESTHQVRIVMTRSHPDYIRRLFELEVPEVTERVIEIKGLAREAGYRTKIAVSSIDSRVDAVGACVGVRGSRIRNIVEELGGEKIDIVRWNESSQILIANALKPAEVQEIALCFELGKATVVVADDQLSLAIGKRGQNVRLAARLTGWEIDILTPPDYNRNLDDMEKTFAGMEGIDDVLLDRFVAMGLVSVADVDEVGEEPLVKELGLSEELAARISEKAAEAAIVLAEEAEKRKAEKAAQAAAEAEAAAQLARALQGEGQGSEPSAVVEVGGAEPAAAEPAAAAPAAAEPASTPEGPVPSDTLQVEANEGA